MTAVAGCSLCEGAGGRVVLQTSRWRLVNAEEPDFPAFYRLVWNRHVREFSELAPEDRGAAMEAVVTVEQLLLRELAPTKMNLASLGNAVPHVHWHVIARFDWDTHFPGSVWAPAQRPADPKALARLAARLPSLEEQLRASLSERD